MTIINESRKNYQDILKEIFNERQLVKISFMTKITPKLAVKKDIPNIEDKIIEDLKLRLLKDVKISIPYIVRKYKVTPEHARELIIRVSTHECCEWDFQLIDYFSPEFECCCQCFRDDI